jgi:hypothetical protein
MLTSVYKGAFTRRLRRAVQGTGFEGCFAREQDGNRGVRRPLKSPAVIGLQGEPDQQVNKCQMACKPGSVQGVAAPEWPFLWDARRRTPRATYPRIWRGKAPGPVARPHSPIWSCSRWGLPCRRRYRNRGALLPHRFTLTAASKDRGGLISVALSLRSLSPGVTRHRLSVEPGLSSTASAAAAIRPSGTAVS